MKVLLINPPFERLKGIAHIYFPLGLGYLCSALSDIKTVEPMIYNAELPHSRERLLFHMRYQDMLKLHNNYIQSLGNDGHYVWREIHKIISEFNPDVIALSVMTAKYGSALKVSGIAKSINSRCRVIWGGPHATIDSQEILKNDSVDFVVRGEGDITLKSLVNLLIRTNEPSHDDLSKIEGLSYKDAIKVIDNPDRPLVEDLDTLNFPQRDKVLFPERYLPSSWGDLVSLRGCPFKCGYCGAHNTWTKKVRYRSVDNLLEEIEMLISKYNLNKFYFWDDNFTLDRDRAMKFCRSLRDRKIRINWGCTTRVDLLDDLLLDEMKKAGCDYISIGIESGSERMLKSIDKGITLEAIDSAVKLLDKFHLKYEAFFMIGFPEERVEDIEKTFNLMKKLKNADICFSIFTPYPGTEQYRIAKRYELIPEQPDWSRFSHQSQDNHFMEFVAKEDFEKYVRMISSWIDQNNTRNIEIKRLFFEAGKNFNLLIKRPELILNKLYTFLLILKLKTKILFKTPD